MRGESLPAISTIMAALQVGFLFRRRRGKNKFIMSLHFNPFPVRAAIDIGTNGMISLAVGRVDAQRSAVRDLLYQHHLPIMTACKPGTSLVDEPTRNDINAKLLMLKGLLQRHFPGAVEVAALLTTPFCYCSDAMHLATHLSKQFQFDVRVLGSEATWSRHTKASGTKARIKSTELLKSVDAKKAMELLAFDSFKGATKCIHPHKLVVLVEEQENDPTGAAAAVTTLRFTSSALELPLGPDISPQDEVEAASTPVTSLVSHPLSVSPAAAHRLLLTHVQRRGEESYSRRQSPNPMMRSEYCELRAALEACVRRDVPEWLLRKAKMGGMFCGTSDNGGLLNIAARVSQRTMVSVEHLDLAAEFHYCGLTDVLIGHNYPVPSQVLPSAALCSAIMRGLDVPRMEYVPGISLAVGMLTRPEYWTYSRRSDLSKRLSKRKWFTDPMRRTWDPPHKANPASSTSLRPLVHDAHDRYSMNRSTGFRLQD